MADNFLERHREEYEIRKTAWLQRKKRFPKLKARPTIQKPDEEFL